MLAKQKPLLKQWRKALVRNESRLCPRCASLGFSELLEVPTASESAQFFQDQHGSPQGIVLDIYLAPRKQSINLGKSASWATEYCATCVMFNEAKYHNAESETRQDWDGAFEYSLFVFDSYTTTGLDVNVIEAGFAVCSAPPKPIEYANLPLIVPQLHARQTKDKLFRSVKENVDTSLVRNWISICQKSHPQAECSLSRDSRTVPKYLIDCTSRRIVREVAVANYVALSYVWGRPPDNDTMPKFDFVTARLPDRLPKTIDDAITLTKSLGYNYLWADKYCINQDDPVEKAHELACMHRIYADSVLTIVDLAGGNDRDGLAGLSQQRRPSKKASIKDLDLIILPPEPRSQVWTSTWATRGWTYQEGIFARRKVFLGAQETSFVCASMQIRETWGFPETVKDMSRFELRPDKLANSTFGSPRPMLTPEARYWQNVLEYCTKKLSFDEDALNAFRGLLTMYCQDPANFYQVYGMTIMRPDTLDPFRCLARSLMWIPIPLDGPQGRRERRPDFPSWSWLGWKDSIITRFCSPSRNDTFQNLVDHAMVGVNSFNHDGSSAVVYDTFIDGDDTLPRNLNFWTLSQSPRLTHLLALDAPIVTVSLSTSSISPVFMDDFHDHIFLTITSRDGTRTTYPAMLTNVSHYFESEETLAAVMGYHDFDASEYWEGLADSYSLQQWAGNCRAVYLMYLSDYGDESVGHAGATVLAMRNQHFEKFKRSLHPRRFLLR